MSASDSAAQDPLEAIEKPLAEVTLAETSSKKETPEAGKTDENTGDTEKKTENKPEPVVESKTESKSWAELDDTDDEEPQLEPAEFIPEPVVELNKEFADFLPGAQDFKDLNIKQELLDSLAKNRILRPSVIQKCALPYMIHPSSPNIIAQSQSGSGKTIAFSVNILQRIDPSVDGTQAIVLAPSRELAVQLYQVISGLAGSMKGPTVALLLAMDARTTEDADGNEISVNIDPNSHILVATAGTMVDRLMKRRISAENLKIMVLDEADTMIDSQGQGDKCLRIKKIIDTALRGKSYQFTLFSATFSLKVLSFARKFAPNAVVMTLPPKEQAVKTIRQYSVMCENDDDKVQFLIDLYGVMTIASSIIFIKTRKEANYVEEMFKRAKHNVIKLSAELVGEERDKALARFRKGESKVLIATNMIARGIDIESVSLVINFNIPEIHNRRNTPDIETYIHRIGRTGRFGRSGVAVNLVTNHSVGLLDEISSQLEVEVKPLEKDVEVVGQLLETVITSKEAQAGFRPEGFD